MNWIKLKLIDMELHTTFNLVSIKIHYFSYDTF